MRVNMGKKQSVNCVMCERPATVRVTPMIKILPDDPQGYIDWKLFGFTKPFCDKHRPEYQVVSIEVEE